MPNAQSLDNLLGNVERYATFHDAIFLAMHVDYTARRFVAEVDVCVGDPHAPDKTNRERRRRGQLAIEGLKLWALEPPGSTGGGIDGGLWLTAEGPLFDSPTLTGRALARDVGPSGVSWFLYFNDLNAFAYLAGESAAFTWS